jgi:hypothetical protein
MAGLVLFAILGYMACIRIYDWWNGYGELF